jgi:SAM-dependent methyltransferase
MRAPLPPPPRACTPRRRVHCFPTATQPDTNITLSTRTKQKQNRKKTNIQTGLGMVAEELKANPVLTDWTVHDLNKDPKLPYPDNTFDVVTNCVRCALCARARVDGDVLLLCAAACVLRLNALFCVFFHTPRQIQIPQALENNHLNHHPPHLDHNKNATTSNQNSVDYLNRPLEVFKEVHRVLKPGGRAVMSFRFV